MSRQEEAATDEAEAQAAAEETEAPEPMEPPIDGDIVGSVNAALHDDADTER